jgi:hypothetical protein
VWESDWVFTCCKGWCLTFLMAAPCLYERTSSVNQNLQSNRHQLHSHTFQYVKRTPTSYSMPGWRFNKPQFTETTINNKQQ